MVRPYLLDEIEEESEQSKRVDSAIKTLQKEIDDVKVSLVRRSKLEYLKNRDRYKLQIQFKNKKQMDANTILYENVQIKAKSKIHVGREKEGRIVKKTTTYTETGKTAGTVDQHNDKFTEAVDSIQKSKVADGETVNYKLQTMLESIPNSKFKTEIFKHGNIAWKEEDQAKISGNYKISEIQAQRNVRMRTDDVKNMETLSKSMTVIVKGHHLRTEDGERKFDPNAKINKNLWNTKEFKGLFNLESISHGVEMNEEVEFKLKKFQKFEDQLDAVHQKVSAKKKKTKSNKSIKQEKDPAKTKVKEINKEETAFPSYAVVLIDQCWDDEDEMVVVPKGDKFTEQMWMYKAYCMDQTFILLVPCSQNIKLKPGLCYCFTKTKWATRTPLRTQDFDENLKVKSEVDDFYKELYSTDGALNQIHKIRAVEVQNTKESYVSILGVRIANMMRMYYKLLIYKNELKYTAYKHFDIVNKHDTDFFDKNEGNACIIVDEIRTQPVSTMVEDVKFSVECAKCTVLFEDDQERIFDEPNRAGHKYTNFMAKEYEDYNAVKSMAIWQKDASILKVSDELIPKLWAKGLNHTDVRSDVQGVLQNHTEVKKIVRYDKVLNVGWFNTCRISVDENKHKRQCRMTDETLAFKDVRNTYYTVIFKKEKVVNPQKSLTKEETQDNHNYKMIAMDRCSSAQLPFYSIYSKTPIITRNMGGLYYKELAKNRFRNLCVGFAIYGSVPDANNNEILLQGIKIVDRSVPYTISTKAQKIDIAIEQQDSDIWSELGYDLTKASYDALYRFNMFYDMLKSEYERIDLTYNPISLREKLSKKEEIKEKKIPTSTQRGNTRGRGGFRGNRGARGRGWARGRGLYGNIQPYQPYQPFVQSNPMSYPYYVYSPLQNMQQPLLDPFPVRGRGRGRGSRGYRGRANRGRGRGRGNN